jgi:hypothetical protein
MAYGAHDVLWCGAARSLYLGVRSSPIEALAACGQREELGVVGVGKFRTGRHMPKEYEGTDCTATGTTITVCRCVLYFGWL